MIANCTCKHEYQDKIYGVGKRTTTPMKAVGKYRCTVCGKEVIKKVVEEESKKEKK